MSHSDNFVEVGHADEMPPGSLTGILVDGQRLVVANVEGTLYAFSGLCSHLGTFLELGTLRSHRLTCFAHLWTYDVRNGEPVSPPMARVAPGYRLRTYSVRIEDGAVFVSRIPGRRGLN